MANDQTQTIVLSGSDLAWLAGVIEGDGCFSGLGSGCPTISIQMVDEDTICRVSTLLQVTYRSSKVDGYRELFRAQIRGPRAIAWMKTLIPLMGMRRTERIEDLLEQYAGRLVKHGDRLKDFDWESFKQLSWRELGKAIGVSHETARRLAKGLGRHGKPRETSDGPHDLEIKVCGEPTDLDWMAGYLEAEGSFMKGPPSSPNCPIVSLQTTDLDVANKYAELVSRGVSSSLPKGGAYKRVYLVYVRGQDAMRWMRLLRPLMSIRRKRQIDVALASHDPTLRSRIMDKQKKLTDANVLAIPALIEQGKSLRSIARAYGVHHETIRVALDSRLPRLMTRVSPPTQT